MSAPKNPRTTLAVVTPAQIAPISAVDIMPVLLSELQKADQIIIALLNAMTLAQKTKVAARLDAAGVSGEGMTRHHERRAVIVAAEAVSAQAAIVQAQSKLRDVTPAPQFSQAEIELVTAFRAMTDRARSQQLRVAKRFAADCFSLAPRPALRLVVGGAA